VTSSRYACQLARAFTDLLAQPALTGVLRLTMTQDSGLLYDGKFGQLNLLVTASYSWIFGLLFNVRPSAKQRICAIVDCLFASGYL
jgi:hypothetical protein